MVHLIMKVEISKEQKEALGKKLELCVAFLKKEVQPHIVKSDKIEINMSESLDLFITSDKIYVTETTPVISGLDIYRKKVLLLENPGRKKAKKYICEAHPELAVSFLQKWDKAKEKLIAQVKEKVNKVATLNAFVDNFDI